MAYNKAREERKWRIWKQSEEKKLRELGVGEDKISKLREHDWANFNSDRRYYQRVQDTGTYLDELAASEQAGQSEIKTVEDFLDSIENEKLYCILVAVNKQTLQAALLKTQGFSVEEISLLLGLNEQTIYKRLIYKRKAGMKMADLRFERTEQMLQLNFLKLLETTPFSDISIAKLAKASLIDRTTFYAHYENIYELAEQLIDQHLEHFSKAFEQNIKKREQEKKFDSYSFLDEKLHTYLAENRKKIMLVRALNLGINSFDAKLRRLFKREYAETLNISENDFTIYLLVNLAVSNIDFTLEKQRVPSKKELKEGLVKIEEYLS